MSSYLKGIANRVNGVEKNSFTKELDINSLVPSQNNFYGIREIEELAESIKENGLMHNLVVRKLDNGTYEILSGERRYRACKLNGLNKIPCLIKENLSDLDAELLLIQANSEQRELTPTEKMEGIKRLEAIYKQKRRNGEKLEGKTRDLIGKDLGLSGVQVGRYQKVDKGLIEPLKEKLDKDEITLTQAHTLSSLTKNEQNIIHEEIKGMNAKEHKEELETLVNGIKQPITSKKDKKLLEEIYPTKNEALKFLQNAIDEFQLNPKVIIKANNIESVLYTSLFKIQDNLLKIEIRGFSRTSTLNINVKSFRKAMSVEIEPGKILTHEHLFLINNDIYVWFTEKFDFNK
nr:ParB N-terminal domain-containing protein [Clostridium neonatale]